MPPVIVAVPQPQEVEVDPSPLFNSTKHHQPWNCSSCGHGQYVLPAELVKQVHDQLLKWHEGGLTEQSMDKAYKSKGAYFSTCLT